MTDNAAMKLYMTVFVKTRFTLFSVTYYTNDYWIIQSKCVVSFRKFSFMWFKSLYRVYLSIDDVVLQVIVRETEAYIFDCSLSWTHRVVNVYSIVYICLPSIDNSLLEILYPWCCRSCHVV